MVGGTAYFKTSDDIVARDVPDGMMLVNVQTGAAFKLNRVGAQVWRQLDGSRVVDDVVSSLRGQYQVAPDQLQRDVEALIEELQRQGLIGRASDP